MQFEVVPMNNKIFDSINEGDKPIYIKAYSNMYESNVTGYYYLYHTCDINEYINEFNSDIIDTIINNIYTEKAKRMYCKFIEHELKISHEDIYYLVEYDYKSNIFTNYFKINADIISAQKITSVFYNIQLILMTHIRNVIHINEQIKYNNSIKLNEKNLIYY